jgi:hypothetical protein
LATKLYQDANKIVWIRLDDYKYPRTALYLTEKYHKMALCEAHNHQFGGHNAAQKTDIRLTSSYYWPKIYSDILKLTKTCLKCQQSKKSMDKPPLLQPLPTPDQPNTQIHADQSSLLDGSTNTICASRFHQVCISYGCGKQGGQNCGEGHFSE